MDCIFVVIITFGIGSMCNMKEYIVKFIKHYYICLTQIYMSIIAAIIFLAGIGRYRSILFLSIYFMVYSLVLLNKSNVVAIKKIYAPLLVVAIFFDIKNGPVLPVLSFNNIIIAFVAYFSLKWLLDGLYKKAIEGLTNKTIFTCCPKCNFETNQFAVECNNCGYSSINLTSLEFQLTEQKVKLHESLLDRDEVIRKTISLGFLSDASIYKNGSMLDCNKCIITNQRIILMTKQFYRRGISNKFEILLSAISNVHIEERKHHGLNMNIIVFTEQENSYELFQIHKRSYEELVCIVELLTNNIA